jgi:hypothetical protein
LVDLSQNKIPLIIGTMIQRLSLYDRFTER